MGDNHGQAHFGTEETLLDLLGPPLDQEGEQGWVV